MLEIAAITTIGAVIEKRKIGRTSNGIPKVKYATGRDFSTCKADQPRAENPSLRRVQDLNL